MFIYAIPHIAGDNCQELISAHIERGRHAAALYFIFTVLIDRTVFNYSQVVST